MNDVYPISEVLHAELHSASYQPASRVNSSVAFNALKRSMQDDGLQYPPLVVRRPDGNGYNVIDGHRRIAVLKELGYPKVPVIISTQGDARKLYSAVSGNSKPLSSVEWIHVHLGGGTLPSGPNTSCINQLQKTMGPEFLNELAAAKMSPQIWNQSARVLKYLDLSDEERPNILRWMLRHKLTRQLAAAMQGKVSSSKIKSAYETDSTRF